MSNATIQKDPVNRLENGTVSISFTFNDGREAQVGVFPKGLEATFKVTEKQTYIIIEGVVDFNGVGIGKNNVYAINPALGETFELRVWSPYTDVAYERIYG